MKTARKKELGVMLQGPRGDREQEVGLCRTDTSQHGRDLRRMQARLRVKGRTSGLGWKSWGRQRFDVSFSSIGARRCATMWQ